MTTSDTNAQQGGAAAPAVQAEGVEKYFGSLRVLKGIDMTVMPGTVTVILGPSGSGKSTFLRLINQLETLSGGSITINGELMGYRPVTRHGRRMLQTLNEKEIARQRAKLGMVFQRFNLFPHKTALENVMEAPVYVAGEPKDQARGEAVAELERVGLGDRLDYYPAQ
ncbi:MAG: ATP-binding cassette domain-containing protein, partial [Bifidobacterium mongoliense]|nr:ATP-binding cassette domain-containing protein [Bifidobacterium mongoliense]